MHYDIYGFQVPRLMLIGNGSVQKIGEESGRLNAKKALLVTDKGIVKLGLEQKAIESLRHSGIETDIFSEVEPEPSIGIVEKAAEAVRKQPYDLIIGFGGGSPMDVAKVVAYLAKYDGQVKDFFGVDKIKNTGLPIILVPTTSGTGAEVSPNSILTDMDDNKKIVSSRRLFADVVIVDPLLTLKLPPRSTALTGIDALTHAMGAYITRNANPLSDILCLKAIELISGSLRRAVFEGEKDLEARHNMSVAATIGMIGRVNSGTGAVHGLAYPLGTRYHLPHAEAIALLLPYVMEYNVIARIPKFVGIAMAMGEKVDDLSERKAAFKAITVIKDLLDDIGITSTLKDIGVDRQYFPEFAELVFKYSIRHVSANPRSMTRQDIVRIYENAFEGKLYHN